MKRTGIAVCALLLAATSAFARGGGRGFSGGHAPSVGRGFSGGRTASRGFSGGFSRALSRPSFGRATSFRVSTRPAASRSFGRATFHATAAGSRRVSGSASGSASPAWATIGSKIVGAGQPPVYSQAAGGGTHSVEGGGFVAMDQSRARDVGRAPGISWAPPDASSSGSRSGSGGGTGASSNGPAFDPSF